MLLSVAFHIGHHCLQKCPLGVCSIQRVNHFMGLLNVNADPGEMSQNSPFHLDIHCLLKEKNK